MFDIFVSDICELCMFFFCFLFTIGGMIQAECMTVAYLFMCFSTLSTWLVVMMTFDRCVAVVKPFYHPKWRSIRSTGFIIGTIFIVCSLVNIPYIFSSKVSFKDIFLFLLVIIQTFRKFNIWQDCQICIQKGTFFWS